MKKLFFFAAILAVLAGCSQNETVKEPASNYISFSNAYVDNATRTDYTITLGNLNDFDVFGFYGYGIDNAGAGTILWSPAKVVKSGASHWTFADPVNTKTWEVGFDYYFQAIAPSGAASVRDYNDATTAGLDIIDFTNDGTIDLLYAENSRELSSGTQDFSNVMLSFNHLLSRIKFTFESQVTTGKKVGVRNVTIMALPKSNIKLNAPTLKWNSPTGSATALDFGDVLADLAKGDVVEAEHTKFMIPFKKVYDISFELVYDGQIIPIETSVELDLQMGFSYNLKAVIKDSDVVVPNIIFDVNVEPWKDSNPADTEIY